MNKKLILLCLSASWLIHAEEQPLPRIKQLSQESIATLVSDMSYRASKTWYLNRGLIAGAAVGSLWYIYKQFSSDTPEQTTQPTPATARPEAAAAETPATDKKKKDLTPDQQKVMDEYMQRAINAAKASSAPWYSRLYAYAKSEYKNFFLGLAASWFVRSSVDIAASHLPPSVTKTMVNVADYFTSYPNFEWFIKNRTKYDDARAHCLRMAQKYGMSLIFASGQQRVAELAAKQESQGLTDQEYEELEKLAHQLQEIIQAIGQISGDQRSLQVDFIHACSSYIIQLEKVLAYLHFLDRRLEASKKDVTHQRHMLASLIDSVTRSAKGLTDYAQAHIDAQQDPQGILEFTSMTLETIEKEFASVTLAEEVFE